ncbi:ubiquitin-like activating enzyme 2 [Arctopsyche grandis]|uniref:ubiquitin-like activating enzyme 2 n=1 Tax=Arctopsyche grandis TaxID=121162 RepID=UPI00406D9EDD
MSATERLSSAKLGSAVSAARVLVVGAGGIGCEILKNLVLAGFTNIHIIDLDTIDVSNLNRQFLFHKEHVGKSKAEVARETALKFNPNVTIKAYHDSITTHEYGLNFFETFALVMNALDNRAARNHVNRMCLAADVPLIESGTAGYAGQVELIKKEMTECYECQPKATQKSFPGCTIRNTPSEFIHCIVWAKHLFNQLFGEEDPDQDVSPDTKDPEAAGNAAQQALGASSSNVEGNVERTSTRTWAHSCNYDPTKLFNKLFKDDIQYLLSMDNLWKTRRPPTPLDINNLPDAVVGSSSSTNNSGLPDQRMLSIAECAKVFADSCCALKDSVAMLKTGDHLVWDKDDKSGMDFVSGCANIRAHIFGIAQKSRFDIKSMAGNIIPAIATTNAIVAGIVVMHAFNVLMNQLEKCQSVYLRLKPNHRGQLFVPDRGLHPPNPKCYVCAFKPSVLLICDVLKLTIGELNSEILIRQLNMISPDALHDGRGIVLISSEKGETDANMGKTLHNLGIGDGSVLIVDDFHQEYELRLFIKHDPHAKECEIVADRHSFKPKESTSNGNGAANKLSEPSSSSKMADNDSDDDMEIVEDDLEEEVEEMPKKQKQSEVDLPDQPPSKKARMSVSNDDSDTPIID